MAIVGRFFRWQFVGLRIGHGGQAIAFAQPAAEVNRAAALAAKRPRGGRVAGEFTLTDGAAHADFGLGL